MDGVKKDGGFRPGARARIPQDEGGIAGRESANPEIKFHDPETGVGNPEKGVELLLRFPVAGKRAGKC